MPAALAVGLALAGAALTTAPPEPAPLAAPPAAAPATMEPASVPPGDLSAVPPLPNGPLLPVARSDDGETFLVDDRAGLDGDTADFWTYEVFIPPVVLRPGVAAAQGLAHHRVDCSAKTDRTVATAGYDEDGKAVVALAASAPAPLVTGSPYTLIAAVLCRGEKPPTAGAVAGHGEALADALGIKSAGR